MMSNKNDRYGFGRRDWSPFPETEEEARSHDHGKRADLRAQGFSITTHASEFTQPTPTETTSMGEASQRDPQFNGSARPRRAAVHNAVAGSSNSVIPESVFPTRPRRVSFTADIEEQLAMRDAAAVAVANQLPARTPDKFAVPTLPVKSSSPTKSSPTSKVKSMRLKRSPVVGPKSVMARVKAVTELQASQGAQDTPGVQDDYIVELASQQPPPPPPLKKSPLRAFKAILPSKYAIPSFADDIFSGPAPEPICGSTLLIELSAKARGQQRAQLVELSEKAKGKQRAVDPVLQIEAPPTSTAAAAPGSPPASKRASSERPASPGSEHPHKKPKLAEVQPRVKSKTHVTRAPRRARAASSASGLSGEDKSDQAPNPTGQVYTLTSEAKLYSPPPNPASGSAAVDTVVDKPAMDNSALTVPDSEPSVTGMAQSSSFIPPLAMSLAYFKPILTEEQTTPRAKPPSAAAQTLRSKPPSKAVEAMPRSKPLFAAPGTPPKSHASSAKAPISPGEVEEDPIEVCIQLRNMRINSSTSSGSIYPGRKLPPPRRVDAAR